MRKILATLFAAAAFAAPLAYSEGTPISVELSYDSGLLSTEAGAKTVLKSIKEQAKDACTYVRPVTGTITYDRECSTDLVEKAIGEIRLAAVEDGRTVTYVFAALETETETSAQ
ncbi:MAG: UrcA family protein [Henriciella sp.]|nr:UrcA family protein [Henriciella sp.]